MLDSSCISGSGPSIRGVRGCVHHLCCFLLALAAMKKEGRKRRKVERGECECGRGRRKKGGEWGQKGQVMWGKGRERVL